MLISVAAFADTGKTSLKNFIHIKTARQHELIKLKKRRTTQWELILRFTKD
ncbi:hypothetical protein THIOSC13_70102 [uncultured Thiomicrorhabdus sp.]